MDHFTKTWWKEAVGYQIYPKTFYDGNNDGIGDLTGIKKKLPYLHHLGVNFLWICPFFDSPMDDNGYDVRDYYKVLADFGTMEDFQQLIEETKKYDMKIVVDLVLNHTSDEHIWFKNAKADPTSIYHDFYIIQKGKGKLPPTNWGSFFGGSVWERFDNESYYMKIFSKKMPDLNWTNPQMRQELYNVAKHWISLGATGFRIDAIAHIAKDSSFEDATNADANGIAYDWSKFSNLPPVQTYLQEFKQEVLDPYNCFSIGEVGGGATLEDVLQYAGYAHGKFNVVFTFDHIWCNNIDKATSLATLKTDIPLLKKTLQHWQTALFKKAWIPLYWNNHDFNRVVSNYGSLSLHDHSAKALATMMYFMWGTMIIYQGEEIGMTNYPFQSIEDFQDVQAKEQYRTTPDKQKAAFLKQLILSSRDNVRTTMQWDNSFLGGFSNTKKGLLTNPNYSEINVQNQWDDADSILNYYRKIIRLKKQTEAFIYGSIAFFDYDERIVAYTRELGQEKYLILVNLSEDSIPLSKAITFESCILTNTTKPNKLIVSLNPFDAYVVKLC